MYYVKRLLPSAAIAVFFVSLSATSPPGYSAEDRTLDVNAAVWCAGFSTAYSGTFADYVNQVPLATVLAKYTYARGVQLKDPEYAPYADIVYQTMVAAAGYVYTRSLDNFTEAQATAYLTASCYEIAKGRIP